MRFVWHLLSVLLTAGAIKAMAGFDYSTASGANSLGFTGGALALPVFFFWLGRRASKKRRAALQAGKTAAHDTRR